MSDNERVFVHILDKEYQVASPTDEREALHQAAKDLDARMRAVKNAGSIIGLERIAVMVALNLCYELNKIKNRQGRPEDQDTQADINRLYDKLEKALLDS